MLGAPLLAAPANAASALGNDVNGDGRADLIVGAPKGLANGVRGGFVSVVPGTGSGVDTAAASRLTQSSPGVPGTPEKGDRFGESVRSGDVDGDGYADLVVSAPGEDVGAYPDAGLVQIVFGSAKGLSGTAVSIESPQQAAGAKGFGQDLVTGDFNTDGRTDIAVNGGTDLVQVVYGSAALRGGAPKPTPITGTAEKGGRVEELAAGDLNGDGRTDLVSSGSWDDPADQGDVLVFHGSDQGLATNPSSPNISLMSSEGVLDTGDVNGDGFDDLVIPTPYAQQGRIYPGGAEGITETYVDVPEEVENYGGFAVGDVDGDGHADLVSGDRSAEVPPGLPDAGVSFAGEVDVHFGGADWVSDRTQTVSQETPGVPGVTEGNDSFGATVTLIDFTGDDRLDLVAGAVNENDGSGAVTFMRGAGDGFTGSGSATFGAATLGQNGTASEFGTGLSDRVR